MKGLFWKENYTQKRNINQAEASCPENQANKDKNQGKK